MIELEKIKNDTYSIYVIKGTNIVHKDDGPAIVWKTGELEWYVQNKRHRSDGPAVIFPEGDVMWFLNGFKYENKELWFEALDEKDKLKALYCEHFVEG